MKKYILDLQLTDVVLLNERYVLLEATNPVAPLPPMVPGQFAQLRVDGSKSTFLRRPISIHAIDTARSSVSFLVQTVGDGTRALAAMHVGDTLNVVLPLGNGFTLPTQGAEKLLLVGGGVGVAPLLFMGQVMVREGLRPTFLLGARTAGDLLRMEQYRALGDVYVTTEDGSMGEKGFVTQHSLLRETKFDRIACCGPKPMMMAVAHYARQASIPCEVSLENMMACGVGACLCCVEDTQEGHVCVCTQGPVFNVEDLKWQI
ncbi:MAG: dihydroorotate dehydrogenase electron transfer subunit [Bacteroidaceae bacterium]|nr:dihydroorotate dehydrogenase electron transfer subunit [Bacteroidaceae bacterium]